MDMVRTAANSCRHLATGLGKHFAKCPPASSLPELSSIAKRKVLTLDWMKIPTQKRILGF
jgi:hypothetical protein